MHEADVRLPMDALVIRASVFHGLGHELQRRGFRKIGSVKEDSGDAAHALFAPGGQLAVQVLVPPGRRDN
jgi:hypothetical protein